MLEKKEGNSHENKKGDNVSVLAGNDKGKTGEVLEVIPKDDKIVVKGVNIRKNM